MMTVPVTSKDFREFGYQMVDYVASLQDRIPTMDPTPKVQPGFLYEVLPKMPPESPEPYISLLWDVDTIILKGMTFWQHPHFHAFPPSGNGWPSVLGELLTNALGCTTDSWTASPVGTELEIIVLDWMAKFLHLPDFFLSNFSIPNSKGGGCLQSSGSECILTSLIAARELKLLNKKHEYPNTLRSQLKSLLIAYSSAETHSSFAKACLIVGVKHRLLPTNERGEVTKSTLKTAIREDRLKGKIPFFFNAILGSTSVGSFDDLMQIGPVCRDHHIWLHGDVGYAGASFCCEEMGYLLQGLEYLTTLNINASEWFNVNFDCALYWIRDKILLCDVFSGYDLHLHTQPIIDYRFWGLSTIRRFRALKLWFTLRLYGKDALRNRIRKHINMARTFDAWVRRDLRFEPVGIPRFGMAAFKLTGDTTKVDSLNAALVEALNATHKIFFAPSTYKGRYVIRFVICSDRTEQADVDLAWQWISDMAEVLIKLREIQGGLDAKTMVLFQKSEKWKKACKRRLNLEVLKHLQQYFEDKERGIKDIVAESTAYIMPTTMGDLIRVDAMNSLKGEGGKQIVLASISRESGGRPRISMTDSAGTVYHVAGNFFRNSDFQNTTNSESDKLIQKSTT